MHLLQLMWPQASCDTGGAKKNPHPGHSKSTELTDGKRLNLVCVLVRGVTSVNWKVSLLGRPPLLCLYNDSQTQFSKQHSFGQSRFTNFVQTQPLFLVLIM